MADGHKRDPELDKMLENARKAIHRSQALIEVTEKLLEQSTTLVERERLVRGTGWPVESR